jgi:signal transduction histidine kinase
VTEEQPSRETELKFRVDALKQLLMVQERLAIEQADAQERAVETINLRARELARSQAALQEHSRVLDAILESIGDGVVVVDGSGHFTIINAAARNLLGDRLGEPATSQSARTQPFQGQWPCNRRPFQSDKVTPWPPDQLPLARAMRGEAVDAEEMFVRLPKRTANSPEGTWILATARPVKDAQGRSHGAVMVFGDITSRKQAEEELARRNTELARSNSDLEQFAYVASHDLQEPLRMVASFTQLLGRRYRGKLDSQADEFIQYAIDGATRMQRLLNDLLAYSRVTTHGRPFERAEADGALDQALANLRLQIEESGAIITREPLPRVLADPTQLVQLFQNLIANAIKFRSANPPRIHVRADVEAGQPRFAVRDNGIGIGAEHHKRIFQIFRRLHDSKLYPGSGIGLAIANKIVERSGGRIWVEPAPGQGSIFFFTLPSADEESGF